MSQTFPQPPSNSTEVFKAQLEYYQQLKEYHRQQMVLAQEKFDRLKAFLELELPETHQTETETEGAENRRIVTPNTRIVVEEDYSDRSDTNDNVLTTRNEADTDLQFKSNQQAPTKVQDRELSINDRAFETIDSKEIESDSEACGKLGVCATGRSDTNNNVHTATNESDRYLELESNQQTPTKVSENQLSIISQTSNQIDSPENFSPSRRDRKEKQNNYYRASPILQANDGSMINAIRTALEANAQRPMTTKEVYSFIYPLGLSESLEDKMRLEIGKALCDGLKEKLWIRVERGIYAAKPDLEGEGTLSPNSSTEKFARQNNPKETSISSRSIDSLKRRATNTVSRNERADAPNSQRENLKIYELIDRALRSVAPNTMNADDIVNWIYPQSVSSKIWKRTRKSVASALSNHLSKNLWKRVSQGYYRTLASPIQEDLVEKKQDNAKSQTVLTLNSISNSPNTKNNFDERFEELAPNLKTLFEAEARGEILHHNYVANKIFGQNYQKHLPELLEVLANGQRQKLWARLPEDPDCWTLDLSLLPTEEIEFVEEEKE